MLEREKGKRERKWESERNRKKNEREEKERERYTWNVIRINGSKLVEMALQGSKLIILSRVIWKYLKKLEKL